MPKRCVFEQLSSSSLKVKRQENIIIKTSLGARNPEGVIILDYSLPDILVSIDSEASDIAVRTDLSQFQERFAQVIVYMNKCIDCSLLNGVTKGDVFEFILLGQCSLDYCHEWTMKRQFFFFTNFGLYQYNIFTFGVFLEIPSLRMLKVKRSQNHSTKLSLGG